MRWLLLTPIVQSMTVFELRDDDAFHQLATPAGRLARDTGALTLLPVALVYRSGVHLFGGELVAAQALVEESDTIGAATGNPGLLYAWLLIAAWRGVEAGAGSVGLEGCVSLLAKSKASRPAPSRSLRVLGFLRWSQHLPSWRDFLGHPCPVVE